LATKFFPIQSFPKDRSGKGGTSEDFDAILLTKYQTEKKDATSKNDIQGRLWG
jgi:hypothetical protein